MKRHVTLALLGLALFPAVTEAKDTVPTKTQARAYIVDPETRVKQIAPARLLKDKRAKLYRTTTLFVEAAKRCNKTATQVECSFNLKMVATDLDPIRCKGEIWVKLRNTKPIGRFGDYECVTVDDK